MSIYKKLSPEEIETGIKLAELILAKQEIESKSAVSQLHETTPSSQPEIAKPQNKMFPVMHKIDFRTWQSADNQFKTIAKFVSLANWKVTLEKQDGKQTIIDIAILRKEDQDYIENYNTIFRRIKICQNYSFHCYFYFAVIFLF
jgi:hypothetical protein